MKKNLFIQNSLLQSLFKKTTYSKQLILFKIAYLSKPAYYDLFLKNSLFKTTCLMKNN